MILKFKKLVPKAVLPSYAKDGDAGLDLTVTAIEDRNEFIEYKFGIATEIPQGYFGIMIPRSSITKKNLMMKNSIGIIDSGYRGELVLRCKKVKFEDGTQQEFFQIGERAAQLILLPYPKLLPEFVDELTESVRGEGGFGSSGK